MAQLVITLGNRQPVRRRVDRWRMKPLTAQECATVTDGYCPDCGHRGFVLGPQGGLSINIECGGCGSRYNVARARLSPRIAWGQRIAKLGEGGTDWTRL